MKKTAKTPIVKLTEKFDKELLKMLSQELASLKATKDHIIKSLKTGNDDGGLLVA